VFFKMATAATAGSAVLFAVVSATTLRNASRSHQISREGIPMVGEVVAHAGADDVVVLGYQRDGSRTARAPVDFASDYPVGIRYPMRLDPADPARARLVTEPYDATEPHVWAAIPLAGAALWLAHRWRTWRRTRRAAGRGPWWHARATQLDHNGRTGLIAVMTGDDVIAGVPVGPLPPSPDAGEPTPVIVAGELEPGGPVALWWEEAEPVTSLGSVMVPPIGGSPPPRHRRWRAFGTRFLGAVSGDRVWRPVGPVAAVSLSAGGTIQMQRPHEAGFRGRRFAGGVRGRAPALVAAVVLAVMATAGCAGQSERRTVAAATVGGNPGFSPDVVTVHTGDKVDLVVSNATDRTHGFDIEGYGLQARVVDPTLEPERVRFTARRAGTFKIYCHLHPQHLTGTLVVL
jgi:nitrosocyanin